MNPPLLSILIPTVYGREKEFATLHSKICPISLYGFIDQDGYSISTASFYQSESINDPVVYSNNPLPYNVEILSIRDNKEMSIGEKRELLYRQAAGDYSWQIDDDDSISDNAIKLILEAIKQNPDCITFEEYCLMNGVEYKSNHSLAYAKWEGDGSAELEDGFHFHRTPFMKSVIKTEIAKLVPVPHCRFGEDNMWADELQKHLKTEIHIPSQLYRYIHTSSDFNERYGFDKEAS